MKEEYEKLEIPNDKIKIFQYSIMKGGCIRDLINIIYCLDLIFLKEENVELFHKTKEIIFDILFQILKDNNLLIPLLFNENIYEKLLVTVNYNPGRKYSFLFKINSKYKT